MGKQLDHNTYLAQVLTGTDSDDEPNDWEALLEVAHAGRVDALLANALKGRAPKHVCAALDKQARKTTFNGLRTLKERDKILGAMGEADIGPVVLLKGAVLGWLLYPDPLLRAMNDLDLLVDAKQLESAMQVMKQLGYKHADPFDNRPASAAHYHERLLWRPLVEGVVNQPVEIHTGFAQVTRYKIPYNDILSRALPFPQGGPNAYRLADSDQLIHLAVHLAREQFMSPFKHLLDVHLWIERGVDWAVVIERARQWECATAVAQALRLAQRVFDTPLPPHVFDALGYNGIKRQYLDWWHTPGNGRIVERKLPMRMAQAFALLPLMDNSVQRMRYLGAYSKLRLTDFYWSKTGSPQK